MDKKNKKKKKKQQHQPPPQQKPPQRKQPPQHVQVQTSIKKSMIDKNILPVIEWLNGFEWVHTRWCCEGQQGGPPEPYVIFYCENIGTLLDICRWVKYFATVEVEYYEPAAGLRYRMHFRDLRGFVEKASRFMKKSVLAHEDLYVYGT